MRRWLGRLPRTVWKGRRWKEDWALGSPRGSQPGLLPRPAPAREWERQEPHPHSQAPTEGAPPQPQGVPTIPRGHNTMITRYSDTVMTSTSWVTQAKLVEINAITGDNIPTKNNKTEDIGMHHTQHITVTKPATIPQALWGEGPLTLPILRPARRKSPEREGGKY